MSTSQNLRDFIASQGQENGDHSSPHETAEKQLRRARMYGYSFIVLNILQGVYILGFHCIQNEKVCFAFIQQRS